MKYKYVLFDLDGTLTDSKEGITKSVQYSLKKYGIIVNDLDLLEKFIGPPLKESFIKYYKFDELKSVQAVEYYREYFKKYGIFENKVYENVEVLLAKLKKSGFNLIIATSKPTVFARRIIKYFNLYAYFDDIVGSNMDGTRSIKGEVIKYILDKYNIVNHGEVVMVGDRKHDIVGARENNINCIAVSYGYGSIEELRTSGPKYIAENLLDVFKLITNE
ncbi:HAD family hydrolase [Clostridium tyrobutyricum]|uniref:HAD family hydrolase n=1 Tax=Clostridium tyrobutyricum TaxID=1519 RepID=UPI001C3887F0|nr:HAD family hydrolase [Clostridium tyrobutyricum]MBV4428191.1 HAD family hydrolase [Clostridium tyrobutyricum]MBV4442568.1 HAD family hydrolase [Clostridium tyrobutyricum]